MSGIANFSSYAKRVSRANREVHGTPTEAQRAAQNFRHGRLHIHGLECMIEYPTGGIRTGTSPDGTKWKRIMTCPYGRIKRTVGLDGEAVDFFLGSHPESQLVFVISQLDADGNLDEHKCILGTRNVTEAKKTYLSNYPPGWDNERMGEIRGFFVQQFRDWLKTDAPHKNRAKKASIPHDDGEICSCGAARRIEEHTGACHNCGSIQSMVESRLKRTEQGLPSAVRVKGADCDDEYECPKCKAHETRWKNDVLRECPECDHVFFAHEKRSFDFGVSPSSSRCPECQSTATKMVKDPGLAGYGRRCEDCNKVWMDRFAEKMWPKGGNKETCPSVARLLNAHKAATE